MIYLLCYCIFDLFGDLYSAFISAFPRDAEFKLKIFLKETTVLHKTLTVEKCDFDGGKV